MFQLLDFCLKGFSLFSSPVFPSSENYHIVLLNSPYYPINFPVLKNILSLSKENELIVADGAANLLYSNDEKIIPDVIIGDFDSIEMNVLDYYKERGTKIVEAKSQDFTDLQKSFQFLKKENKLDNILVFANNAGRIDHEMDLYNVMKEYEKYGPVFISAINMTRILQPNDEFQDIEINEEFESFGSVGIIPLVGRTGITTEGLKWNLDGYIELGKQISCSNEISNCQNLRVKVDNTVLFVTKLAKKWRIKIK